jgi:hypothetical protein
MGCSINPYQEDSQQRQRPKSLLWNLFLYLPGFRDCWESTLCICDWKDGLDCLLSNDECV